MAEETRPATGKQETQGTLDTPHTPDLLIFVAQLTQSLGGGAKRMLMLRRERPAKGESVIREMG